MYNTQYQYSHDIDWFFLDGQYPIHCASNGGLLPNNIYKAVELQSLQVEVENMNAQYQFRLNIKAIERFIRHHYEGFSEAEMLERENGVIPENVVFPDDIPLWMRLYSWSFVKMAQRGFLSFDRIEGTNEYFLVAYPLVLSRLTGNVLDIIYKLPEWVVPFVHRYDIHNEPIKFVSEIDRIERRKLIDKLFGGEDMFE